MTMLTENIDAQVRSLLADAGRELVEADTDEAFKRADARLEAFETVGERLGIAIDAEDRP